MCTPALKYVLFLTTRDWTERMAHSLQAMWLLLESGSSWGGGGGRDINMGRDRTNCQKQKMKTANTAGKEVKKTETGPRVHVNPLLILRPHKWNVFTQSRAQDAGRQFVLHVDNEGILLFF